MKSNDNASFRDATFGCRDGVHDDRDAEDLAEGSYMYESLDEGGVRRRSLDTTSARRVLNALSVAPANTLPFPTSRWQGKGPPPTA